MLTCQPHTARSKHRKYFKVQPAVNRKFEKGDWDEFWLVSELRKNILSLRVVNPSATSNEGTRREDSTDMSIN